MDYYLNQEALYYEKKAARKTANFIGLGIIFISILSYTVRYLFRFIMYIYPSLNSIVEDPIFDYLYSASITVPGFLVGGIILIKAQGCKIKNFVEFKKPKRNIFPLIFIGLGICMVGNIVASTFVSYLEELFNFSPKMTEIDTPTDIFGASIYIITTAVFPAIVEEFMYRGAVYGSLKKFGKPLAIIISALLFGLMHGNLIQIPFAFVVGLGLGFITAESDSIWPAIIVHFLNNFAACIFDYIEIFFGREAQNAVFGIYMMLLLGLGILFGVLYLVLNKGVAFHYNKTGHISSRGRLFTTIAFSPVIIVFYVFTFISILEAQLR